MASTCFLLIFEAREQIYSNTYYVHIAFQRCQITNTCVNLFNTGTKEEEGDLSRSVDSKARCLNLSLFASVFENLRMIYPIEYLVLMIINVGPMTVASYLSIR